MINTDPPQAPINCGAVMTPTGYCPVFVPNDKGPFLTPEDSW